jgi:predicted enzyme related to lactoylglutathione lyase
VQHAAVAAEGARVDAEAPAVVGEGPSLYMRDPEGNVLELKSA